MDFYGPLLKQACRLTMQSAFVRSGILWAPFPEGALMIALLIFFGLLLIFGRQHSGLVPTLKQVGLATFWTVAAVLVGTLVVGGYEIVVWAPAAVVQDAVSKAASDARKAQIVMDKQINESEIAGLQRQLRETENLLTKAHQIQPHADLGLVKTKLGIKRHPEDIRVRTFIHNFGAAAAENIATTASVVFGDGAEAQIIFGTISPPVRWPNLKNKY
jgi:hypothetical protein